MLIMLRSKFISECQACKQIIRKGELIAWDKKHGAFHSACVKLPEDIKKIESKDLVPVNQSITY